MRKQLKQPKAMSRKINLHSFHYYETLLKPPINGDVKYKIILSINALSLSYYVKTKKGLRKPLKHYLIDYVSRDHNGGQNPLCMRKQLKQPKAMSRKISLHNCHY
jgi:hypothetical protein